MIGSGYDARRLAAFSISLCRNERPLTAGLVPLAPRLLRCSEVPRKLVTRLCPCAAGHAAEVAGKCVAETC
jgi:hypothetical protein